LYRSGCFRRSAQAFEEGSSSSSSSSFILPDRHTVCIPLHRLAWDADAALARYRAAASSSTNNNNNDSTALSFSRYHTTRHLLWEAALDANAAYRQALLTRERHNPQSHQHQECVSWACAMLMASVSEVWLLMQHVPSSNDETNREQESTQLQMHVQMRLAQAALNEGIGLASHCFIMHMGSVEVEAPLFTNNHEDGRMTMEAVGDNHNNKQWQWLQRHLTRHDNERGRVVWRTVQMTRNALSLSSSMSTTSSAPIYSRMSGIIRGRAASTSTKKRRRLDDVPVDPTPAASSKKDHFHSTTVNIDEENVPLRVQELVIEALAWHNNKDSSLTTTSTTRPKRPSALTTTTNTATSNENDNDYENKDPAVTISSATDATPAVEQQNQHQRDQCLEDAISLDPSLQTHFGKMAYTLRILFRALAALATPIMTTATTVHEDDVLTLLKDLKNVSSRQGGVHSSIRMSRTALHLMGCLYARQRGDASKALHAFQGALELDESSSLGSSNDTRNDNGTGSPEHRETIENMVQCFVALGRNEPAVELLLYLLQKQASTNIDEKDTNATPALASTNHCHMGTTLVISNSGVSSLSSLSLLQSDSDECHGSRNERRRLLCQLFSCASCTNDWATCLTVAEELCQDDNQELQHHSHHFWSSASECAHVFALLQAGRPTLALSLLETTTTTTTTTCDDERSMMDHEAVVLSQTTAPSRLNSLAKILMLLYTADAIISTEQGFHDDIVQMNGPNTKDDNNDNDNDNSGISKVDSLTKMAVVILEKIRNDTTNNKDSKLANVVDDLEIAVKTNRGIALIMVGKPMEAMKCFQEASICSCHRSKNGPTSSSSTSTTRLEPHVNIFLSLWKHGYHNDAARVWLRARDMDNNNDDSKATNHDSYSTRLNKTIQEYALLMVGQQQQQQKTVKDKSMVFVEGPHIPSWVVEQKGTTSQLLALDIIALRQVLASQTKHAAKSHLRL